MLLSTLVPHFSLHRSRATTAVCCASSSSSSASSPLPPLLHEATAYWKARGVKLHSEAPALPGSRTTSRLAVRANKDGEFIIGMYEPGTHDCVRCDEDVRCHLPHHPAINEAVTVLTRELSSFPKIKLADQ